MPTLYYSPSSPPCRSVLMLGKMLEINFDLKTVNIFENEHLKPSFINVSNNLTVYGLQETA